MIDLKTENPGSFVIDLRERPIWLGSLQSLAEVLLSDKSYVTRVMSGNPKVSMSVEFSSETVNIFYQIIESSISSWIWCQFLFSLGFWYFEFVKSYVISWNSVIILNTLIKSKSFDLESPGLGTYKKAQGSFHWGGGMYKIIRARGGEWLQGSCFLDTTGQLHLRTHSSYYSLHKKCAGWSQTKPSMEVEEVHKVPPLSED